MTTSERQVFMTSGGVLGQTWSSLKLALKGRALKFLLGLVPALLLTAVQDARCRPGEARGKPQVSWRHRSQDAVTYVPVADVHAAFA